jgi:hypothetical protein
VNRTSPRYDSAVALATTLYIVVTLMWIGVLSVAPGSGQLYSRQIVIGDLIIIPMFVKSD